MYDVCVYVCLLCICMFVCMYVCMYVCVCTKYVLCVYIYEGKPDGWELLHSPNAISRPHTYPI